MIKTSNVTGVHLRPHTHAHTNKYIYPHMLQAHKKNLRVGLKVDEATVGDRLKPRRKGKPQLSHQCQGLGCGSVGRTLS